METDSYYYAYMGDNVWLKIMNDVPTEDTIQTEDIVYNGVRVANDSVYTESGIPRFSDQQIEYNP